MNGNLVRITLATAFLCLSTPPSAGRSLNALCIRVDFSDFPGETISKEGLQATMQTISAKINEYTYRNVTLACTVADKVYRAADTGASYAKAGDNGFGDIKRIQVANDYPLEEYDVICLFHASFSSVPGNRLNYRGISVFRGDTIWIADASDPSLVLHEFGHILGLGHANFWDAQHRLSDYFGIVPTVYDIGYGDAYDVMGGGKLPGEAFFNPLLSSRGGWLGNNHVAVATGSGTWRIYRFDTADALSSPLLALKVPMKQGVDYWISYRRLPFFVTYNSNAAAYVVASGLPRRADDRSGIELTHLIDMRPYSNGDFSLDRLESGLPVGSVHDDADSGVRFRTVGSGGIAPNEWIDVALEFSQRVEIIDKSVEVDETAGVALVRMRRTYGDTGTVRVDYSTADRNASAGSDYFPVSGTITWVAGDTGEKQIAIPIRPDALKEGSETFILTLGGVSGAAIPLDDRTCEVAILDAGRPYADFNAPWTGNSLRAVVPLPDGKVVVGGSAYNYESQKYVGALMRLHRDGTTDNSFLAGQGFDGPVKMMVAQNDGKLLVGGDFASYNGFPCNRLARLHADGAFDAGFATNLGSGPNGSVSSIEIGPDGRILVAWSGGIFNGVSARGLVRLTATGALDSSDPLILDPGVSGGIRVVLAQPDGKIMIGGQFGSRTAVRLNPNGSLDGTFVPRVSSGYVATMDRLPDGGYVLGGQFTTYDGNNTKNLIRIAANGDYDSHFTPPSFDSDIIKVLVQPSGAILVCGYFISPARRFVRLTPDGLVDATFNPGGDVDNYIYAIAEGNEGELWIAGNFYSFGGRAAEQVTRIAAGIGPYLKWASSNFTAAQIAGGIAAPDSDPDMDGLTNLAEMASGGSPLHADSERNFAPVCQLVEDGAEKYMQIAITKGSAGNRLWYAVQTSDDLQNWLPASPTPGAAVMLKIVEDSPVQWVVRDLVPASQSSRRFARIVVMNPN